MTVMAINKVVYGTNVLVDLTADTVTPEALTQGYTAHSCSGESLTGTMVTQTYRIGSGAPLSDLGIDGDLYFDMGE